MKIKPLFLTWLELYRVTLPLHGNNPGAVKRLHDIWKLGAPSPGSIVRNPQGYDERQVQKGNYEARLVFPAKFIEWVRETANAKGINVSEADVRRMFREKGVKL